MHIRTPTGTTILLDGMPYIISKSHPLWDLVKVNLGDEDALRRILKPNAEFSVGDRWVTRAGCEAIITRIDGTDIIAEVDDCYEVQLVAGQVTPGVENDDDLMEKIV